MGLVRPPLGSLLSIMKASSPTFDGLQAAILAIFSSSVVGSPGAANRIFISMTTPVQDPGDFQWKVYIVFQSPLIP